MKFSKWWLILSLSWKRKFVKWTKKLLPGAPLTNFNDIGGGGGGYDRGSYFIPKKITTSEFVYPKKNNYFFLAYPKKSLCPFLATQKNPSVFFSWPQKILVSFIDPKKSPLAKISDPKKSLGPPVIKICEWGPWETTLANTKSTCLVNTKTTIPFSVGA